MQNLGLFRYLQPSFFSGLLDDPILLINVRPTGRGILIDCGQLHHLAKRVLRSIDAVFVSHAHMDHLMGFDHLLRHVLVAPRTIACYGRQTPRPDCRSLVICIGHGILRLEG